MKAAFLFKQLIHIKCSCPTQTKMKNQFAAYLWQENLGRKYVKSISSQQDHPKHEHQWQCRMMLVVDKYFIDNSKIKISYQSGKVNGNSLVYFIKKTTWTDKYLIIQWRIIGPSDGLTLNRLLRKKMRIFQSTKSVYHMGRVKPPRHFVAKKKSKSAKELQ